MKFKRVYGPEPVAQQPSQQQVEQPPAAEQQPVVAPPPGKMFTQADVDKIITERLAQEQKKQARDKQELLQKMEKLSQDAKEKEAIAAQLEELRIQGLSKEERAKEEAKKLQKEYEERVRKESEEKDKWFKTYSREKILRDITDAAIKLEAFNPDQIVAQLSSEARIAEQLDDQAKPTGDFETRVKIRMYKDGRPAVLDLTPQEAVKAMKEDPERFGNLFKAGIAGGLGGTAPKSNGKGVDLVKMDQDEFTKRFRTDKRSLMKG